MNTKKLSYYGKIVLKVSPEHNHVPVYFNEIYV